MKRFLARNRMYVYGCIFGAVLLIAGVRGWGWQWWLLLVSESLIVATEATFGPTWEEAGHG